MSKQIEFTLMFDEDVDSHLRSHYPKIKKYRIKAKSLDARGAPRGKKPSFHFILDIIEEENVDFPVPPVLPRFSPLKEKPIIIGAGPAGLFCAVRLAEHGISSIVIERGDEANKRMLSISRFWKKGELDPDTNVCYGEGGAGLFSDGKLITRIKSPLVSYVMEKFVDFGAPPETAYLSNPHLGSNKIRVIITQISNWLRGKDCELIYKDGMSELLYEKNKVIGVKLKSGRTLFSNHIVLATGHSATEIYEHLEKNHVQMKPKDFAVGVRVEHPRRYMDSIQYGPFCSREELGAAKYRLSYHDHSEERGVYSFCMCPGGYVLSSGTEKDGIVVNGMSNFARNSPWSNAALVVAVKHQQDLKDQSLLAGLHFQHDIEKKAYELSLKFATGRELPAMTIKEFLNGKLDQKPLPVSSSPSHVVKANFKEIFPPFVIEQLKMGLYHFDKQMPGFLYDDALLIAPETRTSSPLTISRDKQTLVSTSHDQLYPAGEGAGHAGGITSAAVDGVKVAISILMREKLLHVEPH